MSTLPLHAYDPLVLDQDTVVDVPSGDTLEYSALAGGAYKLTKTGGGTLVFDTISNSAARIVVSAGTLDVRTQVPAKPSVLSSAWLYLDATDISTMTCNEVDGVNYITQWRDANGGSVTLAGYRGEKAFNQTLPQNQKHYPFLAPSFCNGRAVVDLGALIHIGMTEEEKTEARAGSGGAYFSFSTACSSMREAFLVVGDVEDAKRSFVDYEKPASYAAARCAPLLGGQNSAHFIRGSIENLGGSRNASLMYSSSTLGASKCAWTLNGADVADEVTEALPDGLNLVEIRADADSGITFNTLGSERNYYAGGLRYGEVVVFDKVLSAAEREEVRAYLSARWLPTDIAGLELGEGASLVIAGDTTLRIANFKASGAASVSGSGTLKLLDVDRTGTGTVTFSQDSQTIRPDVSGLVPDLSFPSGGSITTVGKGTSANGGYLSVAGAFAKKGGGSLAMSDMDNGVDVSVEEGTFAIDPLLAADSSWMHLDASITNSQSMTFEVLNGTNTVARWCDVRHGDSRSAANSNSEPRRPPPMFKPAFQNGLPVLDFGEYNIDFRVPNACGRSMTWSSACTTIRDVFTVASDTEDLDWNFDSITNCGSASNAQFLRGAPFVGNHDTSHWHFLRSARAADGSNRPGILLDSSATIYSTASVMVDGENVARNSAYPAGFHVLNIKTSADACGDSFARDRAQTCGGTRIGEFIVFTNEVAPRVRSALNRGLMSKWLGGDKALVRELGNVSVSEGATLQMPYQTLAPTGDMNVAGSLEVGTLSLSGRVTFAPTASFAGNLELADAAAITFPTNVVESGAAAFAGGTLKLDGGVVQVSFAEGFPKVETSDPVKLMSFASVEGSAEFPLVDLPNGRKVRVFAGEDGLYGTFFKDGMMIIFR